MRGLDPRIHQITAFAMDCRVKPGNDDPSTTSLCDELFRLGDPALDAAGKPDFLADLLGIRRIELGKLRVVEHAEIVEPLLDRAGYTRQLLEIVSDAARTWQRLKARCRLLGRELFDDR